MLWIALQYLSILFAIFAPFQMGTKCDAAGGVQTVKPDAVKGVVIIHFQNGALAEDIVFHPVTGTKWFIYASTHKVPLRPCHILTGLLDEFLGRRCSEVEKILINIQQKTAGVPGRAVKVSAAALRQAEHMLCTGHCHKGQAALLLHGLAGADLTGRKNSLIHSAEKDYRELEAFGGMDRHHFYPVSTLVPVGTGER